jgi:List-Bact-rpt repeat protein
MTRRLVLVLVAALVAFGAFGVATSRGDFDKTGVYSWPGAIFLHVDQNPSGSGWVRSVPYRIDCPGFCTRAYNPGAVVTLSAHPTDHYEFLGWDSLGPCKDQTNPCTITLGKDTEVTALFKFVPPSQPPGQNPQHRNDNNNNE